MANPDAPIVEVLYALPDRQTIVALPFEPGMTAGSAVARSKLVEAYPAIAQRPLVVGIWGEPVDTEHRLKAGDRVEISRPLEVDPRVMRRELINDGRVMGGATAPRPSKPGIRKKARE